MFDSSTASDASAPTRSNAGGRRAALPAALVMLVVLAGGCNPNAVVYFDNTGSKPMVVSVDGAETVTIPPGEAGQIAIEPGEKQLQVERGDQVLFNGIKSIAKSDTLGVARRYLFNLDDRRYVVYTVKYGTNPFEGMVQSTMEDENAVRYEYQKLVKQTEVMPTGSWFEIPQGCYVLTDAPDVVFTRGTSATNKVLARVDRSLYNAIASALSRENPTEEDLATLAALVDEAMIFD